MINIVSKIDELKSSKIKVYPVRTNQASQLGHPCMRYLVHLRLDWDKKKPHTLKAQYIFDEGNLQERQVIKEMIEAGINVEKTQEYFDWKEYQISGKVDGFIRDGKELIPFEIKSMNPYIFERINSIKDFSKKEYLQRYVAQIVLYMFMTNSEKAIFILKNKSTGEIKQINVELTDELYEYAEKLLQKAERINEYVGKGEYPEPIEYNEEVCEYCSFKHLCPQVKPEKEIEEVTDEEIKEKLEKWYSLKDIAKEFSELDKEIKTKFKGKVCKVGNFYISGKWIKSKRYDIPKEIKEKYAKEYEYWRAEIRRVE